MRDIDVVLCEMYRYFSAGVMMVNEMTNPIKIEIEKAIGRLHQNGWGDVTSTNIHYKQLSTIEEKILETIARLEQDATRQSELDAFLVNIKNALDGLERRNWNTAMPLPCHTAEYKAVNQYCYLMTQFGIALTTLLLGLLWGLSPVGFTPVTIALVAIGCVALCGAIYSLYNMPTLYELLLLEQSSNTCLIALSDLRETFITQVQNDDAFNQILSSTDVSGTRGQGLFDRNDRRPGDRTDSPLMIKGLSYNANGDSLIIPRSRSSSSSSDQSVTI